MSDLLPSSYFEDPIQLKAFEFLMSGQFNEWSDLQHLSSLDDDAVMGLVGIGFFDLQVDGELFYKQNQRVVDYKIRCTGHWIPMFAEELKARMNFDFEQFGHFNYSKREACISAEGVRAAEVTRKGEAGDARWYIRQQWGKGSKPEIRFIRFSICEESDSKPNQTVVAAAQAINETTVVTHDNGAEIAAAIERSFALLAEKIQVDKSPATKPEVQPAVETQKLRKPTAADRSAFFAVLKLEVYIEKHYENSSDRPTTQNQKRDLLAFVIDKFDRPELRIESDWIVPEKGKALFESARRYERWIEAGKPDV